GCWSIRLARLSGSKQRRYFFPLRIELLDLVIVSVGDQQFVTVSEQPERVLQPHVVTSAINVTELKQIATNQSLHCAACDVDCANDVRLAIRDVNRFPVSCHA